MAEDNLVEQLLPTRTWGKRFAIMPTPKQIEDLVIFVAQDEGFVLDIQQYGRTRSKVNIGRSSNVLGFRGAAFVNSSKPLQVIIKLYLSL